MIKLYLVMALLIINTQARENPFFPSQGEEDLPYTSNENKKISKLKRASIKLPSTARVIKKVTIEYENLDASQETKEIELENTVDWHLPIFISQSYANDTQSSKKIKKAKHSYKEVAKIKYAKFLLAENSLKIITQDKIIRDFLIPQPHRVVIDLKRDANLRSYIKKLSNSVFTKIRVGNHNGYYRVVIELDGYYRYKLKKQSDGCLITLE